MGGMGRMRAEMANGKWQMANGRWQMANGKVFSIQFIVFGGEGEPLINANIVV